jgi:hypothetical protein
LSGGGYFRLGQKPYEGCIQAQAIAAGPIAGLAALALLLPLLDVTLLFLSITLAFPHIVLSLRATIFLSINDKRSSISA